MAKKEKEKEVVKDPKEREETKALEIAKCKNCRFRIRNLCHRFPPHGDVGPRDGFPRIKEGDWCGEYKRIGEDVPEPEEEQG